MKNLLFAGLSLAILGGCTSSNPTFPSEVVAYRTPVDGHTSIRRVRTRTVITGYQKRAVVEPNGWKKENTKPTSWSDQSVDAGSTATDNKKIEKTMIKEEPKS